LPVVERARPQKPGGKQMEEALRRSEERFAQVFYASPNPMAIVRLANGVIVDVNENWVDVTGFSREEAVGSTIFELQAYLDLDDWSEMVQAIRAQGNLRNHDIRFRTKSGEMRYALVSADTINCFGDTCILFVATDITDRRRLEQQMARLDRLNLVGEMAAGLAHEIRNPLAAARGFVQLLGEKEDCAPYRDYFELIMQELDQASAIISEFLALVKNQPVSLRTQNLNSIVKALLPLIRADAVIHDKYVRVDLQKVPDLPLNEEEIRQLVLNLARNGLEAMAPRGCLTIRTFTAGEEVVLAVKDQGKGITPEVLDRIGTLFFTTRKHTTGLGLAICYSIVRRHRATIAVDTGAKGTTFYVKFKLPRSPAGAAEVR